MNQPQPSYSFFFFFADDLLLAVYFMFILDYGDDVRQKHIRVIFLSGFKMDCKAVETTHNINNALGPGTGDSRSFAKETRPLTMRSAVFGCGKFTTAN